MFRLFRPTSILLAFFTFIVIIGLGRSHPENAAGLHDSAGRLESRASRILIGYRSVSKASPVVLILLVEVFDTTPVIPKIRYGYLLILISFSTDRSVQRTTHGGYTPIVTVSFMNVRLSLISVDYDDRHLSSYPTS